MPPDPLSPIIAAYSWALTWAFWGVAGCALVALAVAVIVGPFIAVWQEFFGGDR
jgi:hypothetical protein